MKICSKCKRVLPLDSFSRSKRSKDGHTTQCKDCRSKYFKNHYQLCKRTVDAYKTHCAKCGCANTYVLTFHHIDYRTKEFEVSVARRKLNDVLKELKKCICLCHNCHQTYHYFYGIHPDKPIETLNEFLSANWTPQKEMLK